jgi:hypothetical protein
MCTTDIGWIVVAFVVGSGFGAIIGISGAVWIAAVRNGSRPAEQATN